MEIIENNANLNCSPSSIIHRPNQPNDGSVVQWTKRSHTDSYYSNHEAGPKEISSTDFAVKNFTVKFSGKKELFCFR